MVACGIYFPITDYLGKPILVLDSSKRVTAVADYDVYGYPNRVSLTKETAHPYGHNANGQVVADFTQPPGTTTSVQLRVKFHLLDTEADASGLVDYVQVLGGETNAALTPKLRGPSAGAPWTQWVQPTAGHGKVVFTSNDSNCCPAPEGGLDCSASCTTCPNHPYTGAMVESYEYRKYQKTASWFMTPLRFPGQYHDNETDFFENWNRYYDPSVGRYLQPEPMLQNPKHVQAQASKAFRCRCMHMP